MGIINAVTGMFKSKDEAPKPDVPKPESVYDRVRREHDERKRLRDLREPKSYIELKQFLKDQADTIRATRKTMQDAYRVHNAALEKPSYDWTDERDPGTHQSRKLSLRQEYRLYHIAYSMLRGRTMEQIEPKTNNPLSESDLKKIDGIKLACARPPREEKK